MFGINADTHAHKHKPVRAHQKRKKDMYEAGEVCFHLEDLHTALYLLRSYCLQLSLHMIQVGLQHLQPTGTNNQRVCESSHASVHLHIMRCIYCYHSHSSVQAHRLEIGLMFASVLCVYFMCACGPVGMCTQRLACESASCLRCWCVSSLRRCVSWFCRRSCDRKFSYVFCW